MERKTKLKEAPLKPGTYHLTIAKVKKVRNKPIFKLTYVDENGKVVLEDELKIWP